MAEKDYKQWKEIKIKQWEEIEEADWKHHSAISPYSGKCVCKNTCCSKILNNDEYSKFCNPEYYIDTDISSASVEQIGGIRYIVLCADINKPRFVDKFYMNIKFYQNELYKPSQNIKIEQKEGKSTLIIESYTLGRIKQLENIKTNYQDVCTTCGIRNDETCSNCPIKQAKEKSTCIPYNKRVRILTSFKRVHNTKQFAEPKSTNRDFWFEYQQKRFFYADSFWEITERIITDLSQL